MPSLHMSTWFGLYAPLGTPKPVLETLNKALREVVADMAVAEQLEKIETVLFPVDRATRDRFPYVWSEGDEPGRRAIEKER